MRRTAAALLGTAVGVGTTLVAPATATADPPPVTGWRTTVPGPLAEAATHAAAYGGATYFAGTSVDPRDDEVPRRTLVAKLGADGTLAWSTTVGREPRKAGSLGIAAGAFGVAVASGVRYGEGALVSVFAPDGTATWDLAITDLAVQGIAVAGDVLAVAGAGSGGEGGAGVAVLRTFDVATGEPLDERVEDIVVQAPALTRYDDVTAIGDRFAVIRFDQQQLDRADTMTTVVELLDSDDLEPVWTSDQLKNYATDVVADGSGVYVLADVGQEIQKVNLTTGDLAWTAPLEGAGIGNTDLAVTPDGPVAVTGPYDGDPNQVEALTTTGAPRWTTQPPALPAGQTVAGAVTWDAVAGLRVAGSVPAGGELNTRNAFAYQLVPPTGPGLGLTLSPKRVRLARTESASTGLTVTNTGGVAKRYWVRGCQATSHVTWVVRDHGTDVTASLRKATYRTPVLAPGASYELRIRATVSKGAPYGLTRQCKLTAEAVGSPDTVQTQRFLVDLRRR